MKSMSVRRMRVVELRVASCELQVRAATNPTQLYMYVRDRKEVKTKISEKTAITPPPPCGHSSFMEYSFIYAEMYPDGYLFG